MKAPSGGTNKGYHNSWLSLYVCIVNCWNNFNFTSHSSTVESFKLSLNGVARFHALQSVKCNMEVPATTAMSRIWKFTLLPAPHTVRCPSKRLAVFHILSIIFYIFASYPLPIHGTVQVGCPIWFVRGLQTCLKRNVSPNLYKIRMDYSKEYRMTS